MGNYKKQEVNTLQSLNSQEKLLFYQVICRFKAFAYPSIINSNPSVNSCGEITISNYPTVAFSDIFLLGKLICSSSFITSKANSAVTVAFSILEAVTGTNVIKGT